MTKIGVKLKKLRDALVFTSGEQKGEVLSDNGGEILYHASLDPDEHKILLEKHGFKVIDYKISDPDCEGASVWLAQAI